MCPVPEEDRRPIQLEVPNKLRVLAGRAHRSCPPVSEFRPKNEGGRFPFFLIRTVSVPTSSISARKPVIMEENRVQLLSSDDDHYGGVRVNMKDPMDSNAFSTSLQASISQWKQQEGFRYHHAEADFLMLVYWIPETTDTLPANASHRVGIGAFVLNSQRQVLVVKENSGRFKGTGVWKFPTGVVKEGEDICTAAVREVKEETGIDTEFVKVLAFRENHKAFFSKSDLFFVCMLQPLSFDIQEQNQEIETAQWMPVEDYAAQPFIQKHELFNYIAKICLAKSDKDYAGFSRISAAAVSGRTISLYGSNLGNLKGLHHTSDNQAVERLM
ncbi:nudix hydrolase 2-like isoform X1 [Alnus glutinosa]|uniref:nudix hydrolase 2-like isoform X1 n=1 Tax=Alnus glutinosa TaxID=3517 RepID=UPI002D76C82B|nr:nudix hydrolase 2-like isoform X1 [Alnus glutinosa]